MKRRNAKPVEVLDRFLDEFGNPPQQAMETLRERLLDRFKADESAAADLLPFEWERADGERKRRHVLLTAAAALSVVLVLAAFWLRPTVAPNEPDHALAATVEVVDQALSVVSQGNARTLHVSEKVRIGEHVRSSAGAVLALEDGSRAEMRSQTEFSLERADDGLRIRLLNGGLIVNAAKQGSGHLYVQTKDLVVSVVGTVFLVNAEEEGSRVAVFEGEVQVETAAKAEKLTRGGHVATNPSMETKPVTAEISWSRNAEALIALLQQQAAIVVTPPSQNPPPAREAFEVASIRPAAAAPVGPGARGGGGGCIARAPEVSPGRFAVACTTVYRLIDMAYGVKNCPVVARDGPPALANQQPGRPTYVRSCVSGGPEWANTDRFDIQANIPQGSPAYARSQLQSGEAPKLQMMIQTLLAARFKLAVRRETRELPVYNLAVAQPGKMKLSDDQTPPGDIPFGLRTNALPRGVMLNCSGIAIPMPAVVGCLQSDVDRPLVDKTDLKGLYDIPARPTVDVVNAPGQRPFVLPLVLDQLGLKLESSRGPVETLVIERVEKPSEN